MKRSWFLIIGDKAAARILFDKSRLPLKDPQQFNALKTPQPETSKLIKGRIEF